MIVRTNFKSWNFKIQLNEDDVCSNMLNIDGIDYYAYSVSPLFKRNKGAHSYIFALYPSQDFVSLEESRPQKVIKISKIADSMKDGVFEINEDNKRFQIEIEALEECKKKHRKNIINIDMHGYLECTDERKSKFSGNVIKKTIYFPFYMMDYAEMDLKQYLEEYDIDRPQRLDLCLQLAEGLDDLNKLGYYHRDIKPDNILIFDGCHWKIGDLGLVTRRDVDYDNKNEFIGPKGWLSPEAMNKYLAEGRGNSSIDCNIDHQSDIFQLGKVFWYILQGNAPIGYIDRSDFFDADDAIYDLIREMLHHSKKRRFKDISDVVKKLRLITENT